MAIYDLFNMEKSAYKNSPQPEHVVEQEPPFVQETPPEQEAPPPCGRDRFFSSLVTRLFFFLLLLGDVFWTAYALVLFLFASCGSALTFRKVPYFTTLKETTWLSLRRALVCGISLFIALFSPAFGIMVACTYFLMYDKSGIEEVIPSSLQSQFREFIPKEY